MQWPPTGPDFNSAPMVARDGHVVEYQETTVSQPGPVRYSSHVSVIAAPPRQMVPLVLRNSRSTCADL